MDASRSMDASRAVFIRLSFTVLLWLSEKAAERYAILSHTGAMGNPSIDGALTDGALTAVYDALKLANQGGVLCHSQYSKWLKN